MNVWSHLLRRADNQISSWKRCEEGQIPQVPLAKARDILCSRRIWKTLLLVSTLVLFLYVRSVWHDFHAETGRWVPDLSKHTFPDSAGIGWTDFAYCQYVTNEDYLCNSVMMFESLRRIGIKADLLMMYPTHWEFDLPAKNDTHTAQLLRKVRDEYRVKLQPIEVQHLAGDATWAESFTKLLAFNQTQYKRVLSLDSDATVLQVRLRVAPPILITCPQAAETNKVQRSQWMNSFCSRPPPSLCLVPIGSPQLSQTN